VNAPVAPGQTGRKLGAPSLGTLGAAYTKTYETGRVASGGKAPFAELVDAYEAYQQARGLKSWRKIRYELAVYGRWLETGGLEVIDVGPAMAEEYQGWLTSLEGEAGPHYASRTVAAMVCTTWGLHKWLAETGVCSSNPFHRLRRVKTGLSLPRAILSEEELATKLEVVRQFWTAPTLRQRRSLYRLHVMVEVLYSTGLRLAELVALEVSDIDWEAGTVLVRQGKGGATRLAWLNEYAQRVLQIYVHELRPVLLHTESALVFGVNGARALDRTINAPLKRIFGITSHSLRHCLGTHLLARGCDLRLIQLILGHEDLDSTALYTRVSKEDLRGQLDAHHPRGG